MRCPSCGFPKMKKRNRDEIVKCKDEQILVPNVTMDWCPRCHDGVYSHESYPRVMAAHDEVVIRARAKKGEE